MKHFFQRTALVACLVGGMGVAGSALAYSPDMGGHGHGMMGRHGGDPAKMQERATKRLAELKTQLKITADQEGAWTAFSSAMQSAAGQSHMGRDDGKKMHDEMQKLTTPERIDRMKAMRAEHQARMDKMADAVKAFYAALTPEQRKVFDAQAMKRRGPMGHHG